MMELQYDSCIRISKRAALIMFDEREVWIPLSVIKNEDDLEVDAGGGIVDVDIWFVEKEGLEYYEA